MPFADTQKTKAYRKARYLRNAEKPSFLKSESKRKKDERDSWSEERKAEHAAYMKEYMRKRRAGKKG